MYQSLFLCNFDDRARNDNHLRLPRALEQLGVVVVCAEHDSLVLVEDQITCEDLNGSIHFVNDFDLIWILGFGDRTTFLDRMQLLRRIDKSRFVNTVDALVYRHGKVGLLTPRLRELQPHTLVSNQPNLLYQNIQSDSHWIVKPNAGSYGTSVFAINRDDQNIHSILETVCASGYVLLQERVDTEREIRVLTVAGKIIGALGKSSSSVRKNKATGAKFLKLALTEDEYRFASQISNILQSEGILFAALDIAHPYLLDVNFVNPGWLNTYELATRNDLTSFACQLLLDHMFGKSR